MKDLFQVIKTIRLSEKATLLSELNNSYVYKVDRRANKLEIKSAVERIFGNKKKYNQFNYRLKQACEADQSKYKDLQASGDDDELQVFVQAVLQARGAPTADIISQQRQHDI